MHQEVHASPVRPRPRGKQQLGTIVTVVEPRLRSAVDAAVEELFGTIHLESVADAIAAVREPSTRVLLLSPASANGLGAQALRRVVKAGPGVVTAALVSEQDRFYEGQLLAFGAMGVRTVVDLRTKEGWGRLRHVAAEAGSETGDRILGAFLQASGDCSQGARDFFALLVRRASTTPSIRSFARGIGAKPSTMMSRFFRARLPSPKKYLSATRLVYARALLEGPGVSIADVANRLVFSSPQSFGRHVRLVLGLSGAEFRQTYGFDAVLQHFTSNLIEPHRKTLEWFCPLDAVGPQF